MAWKQALRGNKEQSAGVYQAETATSPSAAASLFHPLNANPTRRQEAGATPHVGYFWMGVLVRALEGSLQGP